MQWKDNKKGMTLIEIVVVLLISTIIMGITGGMILSSMGYFSEEVVLQQDEEGLGDIANYMRKELSYATDVRVASSKPTDDAWHWLSIKDGKLYKDDQPLLDDSYYQKRTLSCELQGFDNFRLDVHLTYTDITDKEIAKTRTSVELLNLKASKEIEREYAPFSTKMKVTDTQKIYYITKETVIEEKPKVDDSSTVKGQLSCLNNFNDRGTFIPNTKYYLGDYVLDSKGFWWINVDETRVFVASEAPGVSKIVIGWKKISASFDTLSSYEKMDIVTFGDGDKMHYYQAKNNYITYVPPITDTSAWTDLGTSAPTDSKATCRSLLAEQKVVTVKNKLDKVDLSKVLAYNNATSYKVNDIVKVVDPNTLASMYYLKLMDGAGIPGSSASSGWQILARDYRVNSAYNTDDVVLYLRDGVNTIRFKDKMNDAGFDMETEILHANSVEGSKYIEIVNN